MNWRAILLPDPAELDERDERVVLVPVVTPEAEDRWLAALDVLHAAAVRSLSGVPNTTK